MTKIKIPSFAIPKDTKEYFWQRVKLNVDGENIPLNKIHEIVVSDCPYMKVLEESFCIRRIIDDFGDNVYVYYAVEWKILSKKKKR